jgi:hypothetical protein
VAEKANSYLSFFYLLGFGFAVAENDIADVASRSANHKPSTGLYDCHAPSNAVIHTFDTIICSLQN